MDNSKGFFSSFILKHTKLSILFIYNFITLLVIISFYPLIPIFMGYPANYRENSVNIGVSYDLQYIVVTILTISVGSIFLLFSVRGIGEWERYYKEKMKKS
jgi:hypothetical protein